MTICKNTYWNVGKNGSDSSPCDFYIDLVLLPYLDYNTIWLEKWNCIFAANWHSIPPANEYMLLQRVVFLKEDFLAWICLRIFANLKHVKRLFQTRLDLSNCCLIFFLEESPNKVARYKSLYVLGLYTWYAKNRFFWKVLLLWSTPLRHNSAVLGQAALD